MKRSLLAAVIALYAGLASAQVQLQVTGTVAADDCVEFANPRTFRSAGAPCGAGSGAPADAHYYTNQAESGLSAEVVPSANIVSFLAAATYAAARDLLFGVTTTAAGIALLDDADASAQRTTLGLGTAATVATGTSGATIPLLNGSNTHSGQLTFSSASNPAVNVSASQLRSSYAPVSGSTPRISVSGGMTGSASSPAFSVVETLNTSGSPTTIFVNLTNTASGATTKFLDFQVSAAPKFNVALTGAYQHAIVAVGSLPTCNAGAEGTHLGVNDALTPVSLATVVGGGAVHVPVYCDGTNWIVA